MVGLTRPLFKEFPQITKALIFWSTARSREIVRHVLAPHHPIGLRHQDIYQKIHEQFPDERAEYTPETVPRNTVRPPHEEHPFRSLRYLKKIVLPEMVKRRELQELLIRRGHETNEHGERLDHIKLRASKVIEKHPTDLADGEQEDFRWRLHPDYKEAEAPEDDPDPEKMFEEDRLRRAEIIKVMLFKRMKKMQRKARKKNWKAGRRG